MYPPAMPPQMPPTGRNPRERLFAGCGGFLLGGVLGGTAALLVLPAVYGGHPHQDSGSIGEGIGAGIMALAAIGTGFVAGGIAGTVGLVWLSGRHQSRMAAGILSWIGILGAAGLLVTAGIWWINLQAAARRDVIKARERHAIEQDRRGAQDTAGRITPPVTPVPPQPPSAFRDQRSASATVMQAYGELAYPRVTETRIASPSPRPDVPAAAVIQFTNDSLDTVIAYYEPKVQTIRKSRTDYLGTEPRSSDGLQTFVHIKPGSNNDVYVELTAG